MHFINIYLDYIFIFFILLLLYFIILDKISNMNEQMDNINMETWTLTFSMITWKTLTNTINFMIILKKKLTISGEYINNALITSQYILYDFV